MSLADKSHVETSVGVAGLRGDLVPLRGPGRASVSRRLRRVIVGTWVADAALIVTALVAAWQQRVPVDNWLGTTGSGAHSLGVGMLITVVWLGLLVARGAYSSRHFAYGSDEFRLIALSTVLTSGVVGLGCFLVQVPVSRGFVLLAFLLGMPLLLLERYAVRKIVHYLRRRGRLVRRVIAVGGPAATTDVVAALDRHDYHGYQVVGVCLPRGVPFEPDLFAVPVIGRAEHTRLLCEAVGADTVLVTRGGDAGAEELRRIAWDLEGSDIDLIVVPSLTDVAGPRIDMRPVAGLPLVHVEQPQASRAARLPKRAFDVLFATMGLLLAAPVLLVVAATIKAQDGGPVLFRQSRVGRGGKAFEMLKLRTMMVGAEARLDELQGNNESDGVLFKIKRDPRITFVGQFLRRYSLDEIPQLINVVRGNMSIVGPRPPLPSEVTQYADDVHRRLLVRPGLTGLWQVSGRSGLSWDESVRLDLYYVDNWSMTSDLVIIAKTVRAVLGSSGAY